MRSEEERILSDCRVVYHGEGTGSEMCGLGLMIGADIVGKSVGGINKATTKNNNKWNIIVVVFEQNCQ